MKSKACLIKIGKTKLKNTNTLKSKKDVCLMTTRNMEDYLETIWDLKNNKGYIKAKDIADKLEVKRPSVSGMIKKLKEKDFILYEKYGGITLTEKGRKLAKEIKKRHDLFVDFLSIIGVGEKNSQRDACKIEHDVSPETVACLINFIKTIHQFPLDGK